MLSTTGIPCIPFGFAKRHGVLVLRQEGQQVCLFVSAGVGAFAGTQSAGLSREGQFFVGMVTGGTISVMAGGKFANGAYSVAFAAAVQVGVKQLSELNDRAPTPEQTEDLAKRKAAAEAELAKAYESGALSRSARFGSEGAAADAVLGVIQPISEKYGVEIGGFIGQDKKGYYYGMGWDVGGDHGINLGWGPNGSLASYHTHPSGSPMFSLGDTNWVNQTGKSTYVKTGAVTFGCHWGSASCNPAGAARFYNPNGGDIGYFPSVIGEPVLH